MAFWDAFRPKSPAKEKPTTWADPKQGNALSLPGTLNQSDIVPAMYQAWGAYGYQPSITWYQLCNMFVSWEYTAIEKIAKTIASLPPKLYRYEKVGSGKTVKPHTVKQMLYGNYGLSSDFKNNHYKVLKDQGIKRVEVDEHPFLDLVNNPNPDTIRFDFWRLLTIHLELNGAVGIYKAKYQYGNPTELYVLPTTWTGQFKPIPDLSGVRLIKGYKLIDQDLQTDFTTDEIIWPHYTSLRNPFEGMSAVKAQLYAFNTDQYLNQQLTAFYKNGAMFSNMFETEQPLTQEQYNEIAGQLSNYQGAKNAYQKFILHSGLKVSKPQNVNARDAMVTEVENTMRDKMLSAHDMSAGKLGMTAQQNRSNLEVVDMGFFNECIRPRAMLITEYFDKFLVHNYDENLDFEFDYPHFEDKALLLQERRENIANGYSSINEEREKSGELPVEGGDAHFVSGMLVPLASAAEPPEVESASPAIGGQGQPLEMDIEEEDDDGDKPPPTKGGPGSGHHGHSKDPDKVGGSLPRGMSVGDRVNTRSADGNRTPLGRTVTIKDPEEKALENKAFWNKERKAIAWKKFDRVATSYEPLFRKAVKKHFAAVAAQTIDLLEQNGVKIKSNIGAMGLKRRQEWLGANKARMEELTPPKIKLKADLKKLLKPVYLGVLQEVGNDRIHEFTKELRNTKAAAEIGITFRTDTPAVKKWLGKRLEETSDTITKTTLKKVKETLREDFENGESLSTMSTHLRETFVGEETYRADLIARTESTASVNQADLEGIEQLGLGDRVGKIWLAEPDDRTRETHAAAGERYSDGYDKETGEPMTLDQPFEVGDDSMVAPANGGEAGENVNCRCGMVYEIITEEKSFKGGQGSGNFGHSGRPGERGGSGGGGGPGSGRYPAGSGQGKINAEKAEKYIKEHNLKGSLDNPIPAVDERIEGMIDDEGLGSYDPADYTNDPVEEVAVDELRSMAVAEIETEKVESIIEGIASGDLNLKENPISVIKINGKMVITDGNHRAVAYKIGGLTTIFAKVKTL